MVDSRKIAVLGAGRIGESLISGLLSSGWREPSEVAATTRRAERVAELRERYGIEATLSNHDAAAGAALVVIAVKPQDIEGLLGEIGALILPEQTVLTVAAAIPTARIESRLSDGVPVVRAMPIDRRPIFRRAVGPLGVVIAEVVVHVVVMINHVRHADGQRFKNAEEPVQRLPGEERIMNEVVRAALQIPAIEPRLDDPCETDQPTRHLVEKCEGAENAGDIR